MTPKKSAKVSKRSRSVSTSISVTPMIRVSVAIWYSRCSKNARGNTPGSAKECRGSIRMCTRARLRLTGAQTRCRVRLGGSSSIVEGWKNWFVRNTLCIWDFVLYMVYLHWDTRGWLRPLLVYGVQSELPLRFTVLKCMTFASLHKLAHCPLYHADADCFLQTQWFMHEGRDVESDDTSGASARESLSTCRRASTCSLHSDNHRCAVSPDAVRPFSSCLKLHETMRHR